MKKITCHRFWAVKLVDTSLAKIIINEIENLGGSNLRYDSLDDFMFMGNIPGNKRNQLRRYLKRVGCYNIRIEEPDSFWYIHDESCNRQLRPEIIIVGLLIISLTLASIIIL